MKTQELVVRSVILVCARLVAIWILVIALVACTLLSSQPRQPDPIYSPSSNRVLIPTVNTNKEDLREYLSIKIKIQNVNTGEILLEEQTLASARMRWSIQWLNDSLIQLNSSDIGLLCWEERSDKVWIKALCPND